MDPDKALQQLLEESANTAAAYSFGPAMRMVELFEGLNRWLSRGGFPPRAWQPAEDYTGSPATTPRFLKVLDVSTSHIRGPNSRGHEDAADDTAALSEPPMNLVTYEYPEGWWIYVPGKLDDDDFMQTMSLLPKSIADVLLYGQSVGADWIKLDADGVVYEGLPTYAW